MRIVTFTDANEKPLATDRTINLNRDLVTAFYRQEEDPNKTLIFTADGKSYLVKEPVQKVYQELS